LKLQQENGLSDKELQTSFAALLIDDVFDLLANLLRLTNGQPFTVVPFYVLKTGLGYQPSLIEKIRFLIRMASEFGKADFANLLKSGYSIGIIEKHLLEQNVKNSELREAYNSCYQFTKILLSVYHQKRLSYRGHTQFTKCINANYQSFFASDPRKFVEKSYFNCMQGLSKKLSKLQN
jgi:hypothetical protein